MLSKIVNIEELRAWQAWKRAINSADIEQIEWRLNGEPVPVPDGAYEDFHNLGMNNTDFPALYLGEEGVRVSTIMFSRRD